MLEIHNWFKWLDCNIVKYELHVFTVFLTGAHLNNLIPTI